MSIICPPCQLRGIGRELGNAIAYYSNVQAYGTGWRMMFEGGFRAAEVFDHPLPVYIGNRTFIVQLVKGGGSRTVQLPSFEIRRLGGIEPGDELPLPPFAYRRFTTFVQRMGLIQGYTLGRKDISTHIARHSFVREQRFVYGKSAEEVRNLLQVSSTQIIDRYTFSPILCPGYGNGTLIRKACSYRDVAPDWYGDYPYRDPDRWFSEG